DAPRWDQNTLVPIWSATKGPAAATLLLALEKAGLSVHTPVADLWPELRAARETELTVGQVLAHRSGLAALDPDNRPAIHQHREVVRALERQEPFWQPNFSHGYHPRTSGALLEELVRRVTNGTSLGRFWKEQFALPLGIDVFIGGLGASEVDRLATMYPPESLQPPPAETAFYAKLADPESLSLAAFSSPGGMRGLGSINKLEYLQPGIPSLGGVASARGLAKFYAVLANRGRWKGVQVLSEKTVAACSVPLSEGEDLTLKLPTAFSTGFVLDPVDPETGQKIRSLFGSSRRSFGQPGAGGSHAFADPENGISFAYVMNQMRTGILPNEKSTGLVNLMYS
ncbi:MAG: beta-lactamase family protein, partial [Verrucomicrobiales bacterium]|nr:beta-lactamase family protein [Verrucomicrobiales bacterium]